MNWNVSITDIIQATVACIAIVLSFLAYRQAQKGEKNAESRAVAAEEKVRKSEDIKHLLGEKESVGYAAIKLLKKDALGDNREEVSMIITAIVNACLFENSDRATAMLYSLIEKFRKENLEGFLSEYNKLDNIIESMKKYEFIEDGKQKELDLKSARLRLRPLEAVIKGQYPVKRVVPRV